MLLNAKLMLQSAATGLITGCVAALVGLCLVLTYRMARVINFAQAALGCVGAFTMLQLYQAGWAFGPAALVGMLAGAALSVVVGATLLLLFPEASADAKTGLSIGVLVSLLSGGLLIFGDGPNRFPEVLPNTSLRVFDVVLPGPTLAGLGMALVLAVGLAALLKYTRVGAQLRAVSVRPTAAEVLGIPVRGLTVAAWAGGGAITTAAMIVIAPSQSGQFYPMSLLVLPGLAAALCGLFRSLLATLVGGILIGIAGGILTRYPDLSPYQDSVPFVFILVVLLLTLRNERWDAAR